MTSTPAAKTMTKRPMYPLFAGIGGGALIGVLVALVLTATRTVPGIVEPSVAVTIGLPVTRVILDLAAVITVGLSLLPKLIDIDQRRGAVSSLVSARRIALVSSAVWMIAALGSLILETVDVNAGQAVGFAALVDYVRQFSSGQALLIVAVCALLYVLISVIALRRRQAIPAELLIVISIFALLPLPATGHAANASGALRDLGVISMELHVLGAVLWIGGLLAVTLLLATNKPLLATALPNFSTMATVCVFLTAATGIFNGWFELYVTPGVHWYLALIYTGYGRIVLLKAVCLVTAGLVGAHIRFRLLPKIRRQQAIAMASWAAMELTVLGLAFGLAAVLVRAPVVGGS